MKTHEPANLTAGAPVLLESHGRGGLPNITIDASRENHGRRGGWEDAIPQPLRKGRRTPLASECRYRSIAYRRLSLAIGRSSARAARNRVADRYRFTRELGRGGWGIVYAADDLRHHRQVAIKVLRVEMTSARGRDRFLREIEIAARLEHPNVLPLYDSGEYDGILYYVMPFVAGESLHQRVARDGPLPIEEAKRAAARIRSSTDTM